MNAVVSPLVSWNLVRCLLFVVPLLSACERKPEEDRAPARLGTAATATAPASSIEETPSVASIFDRFVAAVGMKTGGGRIETVVVKGTSRAFLKKTRESDVGSVEGYFSIANEAFVLSWTSRVLEVRAGSNGKVSWKYDKQNGYQLDDQRATVASESDLEFIEMLDAPDAEHWAKRFKRVEMSGSTNANGKPCFKVTAALERGQKELLFDCESGLLTKVVSKADVPQHPQGGFPMETYFTEYESLDGIMLPKRVRIESEFQDIELSLTFVVNEDVAASRVELPVEIRALLARRGASTGSGPSTSP